MPENLPKDIQYAVEQALDFNESVLLPLASDLSLENRRRVVDASKAAGFFQKTQPEEYGGNPASTLELTALRETFAASNSPLARFVFGPGPGVLHSVEGELRENYLEPVLRGEKRGTFGFTEPDSAERPSWGVVINDELVVNGQKSYVTGGADADFVSALINVEKDDGAKLGTAMVVLDMADEGLEIEREFTSLDGSNHVAMRFNSIRVPLTRLVGRPGEGMPRALANIGNVRMLVSAQAMGMCLWVIDFIEGYLQGPHRSGVSLSEREGVRLRYADMRLKSYVARSALYRTARLVDRGVNAVNETAMIKVFVTETLGEIVDTAVQLYGGQALVTGHPLELLYREVRSFRFVEGASDLLRLNIAKGRFELGKGGL